MATRKPAPPEAQTVWNEFFAVFGVQRRLDPEHVPEAFAEVGIEVVQDPMDAARGAIDLFARILGEGHEVALEEERRILYQAG